MFHSLANRFVCLLRARENHDGSARATARGRRLASWTLCLLAACVALTFTGSAAAAGAKIRLITYYSPSRGDYFTTTQDHWNDIYLGISRQPYDMDYVPVGVQGHVFNPDNPAPAGTVPLFHWFSPERGDNFLTSNSFWAGSVGETVVRGGSTYFMFRIEGFIPTTSSPSAPIELKSYWSANAQDNAALATWHAGPPGDYFFYRTEGFLLAPESSSLDRCMSNATPNHVDAASWQARGNYIDTWSQPADFFNGDTVRLTAPADIYRIDFWGHQYPVRGYSFDHALSNFPLPGEASYALMARVTQGRAYVPGRGWFEANTWFRGLGDGFADPGTCVLYDATGASDGHLQTSYNDPNISDNGGWANVTVQQWW